MPKKLQKTELWITAFGVFAVSVITQLDADPVLLEKAIVGISGIVAAYVASRGVAKFSND